MKVVILAGGLGTRLQEETSVKPKPMVEIGGRPMLWHIMKLYAAQGYREFVVALGYKGGVIKDYFLNYRHRDSNLVVRLKSGEVTVSQSDDVDDWTVHLIDTGNDAMTGGRIKKASEYIGNEPFMVTYGDGVADVKIDEVLAHHKEQGLMATVTAVRPRRASARFIWKPPKSRVLKRSPRLMWVGSMAVSLFLSRKCAITLPAIILSSSESLLIGWPAKVS